jgi:hypothetical protein
LPSPQPTTFRGWCDVDVYDSTADAEYWRPDIGCDSGAVYLYVRNGGTWSLQSYLKSANERSGNTLGSTVDDRFGESVALSADGDTVVVGAPGEASSAGALGGNQSLDDAPASGAAYRALRALKDVDHDDNPATPPQATLVWTYRNYIKATNPDPADEFGGAVALSADGKTLAVGASAEASGSPANPSDNTQAAAGAAYLY